MSEPTEIPEIGIAKAQRAAFQRYLANPSDAATKAAYIEATERYWRVLKAEVDGLTRGKEHE